MDNLTLRTTDDGSLTFFSGNFGEHFHSMHGAKQEAETKYVEATQIPEKARCQDTIRILDVCYGLGYNSAAAIECVAQTAAKLEIIALELNSQVPQTAIAQGLLDIWSPPTQQALITLATNQAVHLPKLDMQLLIDDARQAIALVPNQWADAIFLDPFSPPRCPQLWTVEFMQLVANCLKPNGYLVTYSCAAAVRSALLKSGLSIGSTTPFGRKAPGTIAAFPPIPLPPISELEQEILQTRASIPYRDPTLTDVADVILERRKIEQQNSNLESSSSWVRRNFK